MGRNLGQYLEDLLVAAFTIRGARRVDKTAALTSPASDVAGLEQMGSADGAEPGILFSHGPALGTFTNAQLRSTLPAEQRCAIIQCAARRTFHCMSSQGLS